MSGCVPQPRNTDLGCIKLHIPTWYDSDEVFILTEQRKLKKNQDFSNIKLIAARRAKTLKVTWLWTHNVPNYSWSLGS